MPNQARPAPRGLAISPLIVVLALAFVGLAIYRLTNLPPGRAGAYGAGYKFGLVAGPPIFGLVVGFIAYRLCRRSDTAFNLGFGIPVALATFNLAMFALGIGPGPRKEADARKKAEQREKQHPHEALWASRPQPMTISPPAPAPASTPTPAPQPSPFPSAPRPSPQPPPPSTLPPPSAPIARPEPAAPDPRIESTIAALRAEIDAECNALADNAARLFDAMAKTPKPIRPELDARTRLAQDVRDAANAVRDRVTNFHEEAQKRLESEGITDAFGHALRSGATSDYSGATTAAFHLLGFVDRALEETNLLRDNVGHWGIRSGRFATDNKDLQRRYDTARFFIDAALPRRNEVVDPLRRAAP